MLKGYEVRYDCDKPFVEGKVVVIPPHLEPMIRLYADADAVAAEMGRGMKTGSAQGAVDWLNGVEALRRKTQEARAEESTGVRYQVEVNGELVDLFPPSELAFGDDQPR